MRKERFIPYDKESGPPLPIRKDFWKDILPKIKQGVVALEGSPRDESRWRDIYYAAMPEIIDAIYREVIANFKRPVLEQGTQGFFVDFMIQYTEHINQHVREIRERLESELLSKLDADSKQELSPLEASLLSQMFNDDRTFNPASDPFFIYIGTYGYIYEQLLKEKFGPSYSHETLYQALENTFKDFLLGKTATPDILGDVEKTLLYGSEYWEKGNKGGVPFDPNTLDYSYLYLDENNMLRMTPDAINTIHTFLQEKTPTESLSGRTEERGCPVLYAKSRDEIYNFGVREYIAQHKIRQLQERSTTK